MPVYRVALLIGILHLCLVSLSAQPVQGDLLPIKKDKKWGFVNLKGEIVAEPKYEYYYDFSEPNLYQLTIVGNNKLWGIIDQEGKEILPVIYDQTHIANDQYIIIGLNKQYGVADHQGNILLEPQYDKIEVEKEYIITYKNSFYGLYRGNTTLLDTEYSRIEIDKNYIHVEKNSKYGLADFNGNLLFPIIYDKIHIQSQGIIAILGEKQALYTTDGKLIIEGLFSHIYLTEKYIYISDNNKKQGVYNYTGKQLLPHLYTKIEDLTDDIFIVHKHTQVGLATIGNDLLLPVEYYRISYLYQNLAVVSNASHLALFNFKQRKFTSKFEYNSFGQAGLSLTLGVANRENHYFNPQGELIEGFNFDRLIQLSQTTFAFENQRQKLGVIDTSGNVLIKPIFTSLKKSKNEFYISYIGNKKGLIHSEGRILVPAEYQKLEYGDKKIKAVMTNNNVVTIYTLNDKENNIVDITRYNNFRSISVNAYQDFDEEGIAPFSSPNRFLPDCFVMISKRIYMLNRNNEPTYGPYDNVILIEGTQYARTILIEKGRSIREEVTLYGLVDYENRREIASNAFCYIDTIGFAKNNICRAIMSGGRPCLITVKGNIIHTLQVKINGRFEAQPISHIEPFSGGMAQVITGLASKRQCHFDDFEMGMAINKRGSYGYVNTLGQPIIPTIYMQAQQFIRGAAIVTNQKEMMGVINKNNDTIIGFNYSSIKRINDTLFHTTLNKSKYGLIDDNANIISDAVYDLIFDEHEGKRLVCINKKFNFIDREGKLIANEYFEDAQDFNEGYALVKKGKLWGIINSNGDFVIEPKYQSLGEVHNGLLWVKQNKLIGYININEQTVIKPQFKKASDFDNGYAIARKKKKYGVINTSGKWVIKPNYLQIDMPDQYGISTAKVNKQTFVFVNVQNKKLFKTKKKRPQSFSEGLAAVCVKKKYGYIDTLGKFVIPPKYSGADRFSEGLAAVRIKGDWMFIDKNDSLIIKGKFLRTTPFYDGIAVAETRKDKGFVDRNGLYHTDDTFYKIHPVSDDRICVQLKDKKYIYTTRFGFNAIYDIYSYATPFSNNVASVSANGNSSIINTNGLPIANTYFNSIESFKNHQAIFSISKFQGIRDINGNEILKTNYEHIDHYKDNIFQIWDNYRIGYVDTSGNWIYSPTR